MSALFVNKEISIYHIYKGIQVQFQSAMLIPDHKQKKVQFNFKEKLSTQIIEDNHRPLVVLSINN